MRRELTKANAPIGGLIETDGRSPPLFRLFQTLKHYLYWLLGGWVFDRYGAGVLFATAAVMALCNSAFALTVPKPSRERRAAKKGK